MEVISIAGTTGKDAEHKTTQSGAELCSFSVAVNSGWGENKTTRWYDVTSWGKGSAGLANILKKGSKVALTGELSTREHNGKTYLQVRTTNGVTIQGTPEGGERQQRQPEAAGAPRGGYADDLDDDIPF